MELCELVKVAFETAVEINAGRPSSKDDNKKRSGDFVKYLAGELRRKYSDRPYTFVLSKDHDGYRTKFGMNELLYDILVCEGAEVLSAVKGSPLICVSAGVLAIESEMAKDSREAIYDFNKLTLSSCDTKLFVGPLVFNNSSFLEPLAEAARHCSGDLHLALIPHPSEWGTRSGEEIKCWRWSGVEWS